MTSTFDHDGTTIAYTDTGVPPGRPDAPTVVFGHGLLFGGWMFGPQIAALCDRYRCIALDWRGQGESPSPATGYDAATGYDMDTLTGDALALIRRLDMGPVHRVGLSMGGFVGLRLAARHGGAHRSLTLLDTSGAPEIPGIAGAYRWLALVQRIPGARLEIVANCGHTSTLEQPAVISGLLDVFLASVQNGGWPEVLCTDR